MQIQLSKVVKINELCDKMKTREMPLLVAYKFAQLMENLKPQVSFYRDKYMEILRKYAQLDEDGNFISDENDNIKLKEDQSETCIKEINDLENFQVSIDKIDFKLEQLEDLIFTPAEIQVLLPFVTE